MSTFSRTDNSILAQWWWTVDKWMLGAIFAIIGIGIILNFSASPAIAERIGASDSYFFIKRQLFFLPIAVATMLFLSFQSPRMIRRIALALFLLMLILSFMTLFIGDETKGAKRWISLFGFSIQPSEFLKPTFAVLSAWVIASGKKAGTKNGMIASLILMMVIALILLKQPDVGMTFTVATIWSVQFFMSGVSWILVAALFFAAVLLGIMFYFTMPHFQNRIDTFLSPETGDSYQINKALEAFRSGGMFGKGPGEGEVKSIIPDAHTDFIMAVAGEEFGFFLCMIIVTLFAFVIFRGFSLAIKENSLFALLAIAGLLVQFGLQAIINISSTLNLMPTKGMTLPFISHGGSSLVSIALGVGMVLALARKHSNSGEIE
ncbi:MAG: cell division protein FtsW [Alphaproteobacteria bacterium]|nr:cell division protein FtsW [Alphaproteobacteria bacterium]